MSESQKAPRQAADVKSYFEEIAATFDSYYRDEAKTGGLIGRIAHAVFRRPAMACRFGATFEFLGPLDGRRVLDAGCGSGIYCIEIARRGGLALGVDVSRTMIDLAESNAKRAGVADRCRFLSRDLMEGEFPGNYTACLAIGFFDYIPPDRQKKVLERLLSLTRSDVIATFPKKWVPATFFRRIWFLKKKLDVYFFTRRQVEGLVDLDRVEATLRDCRSIWTVRFRRKDR